MPVHLYGQCADMDPIMAIAERHGIPVIEDAAQAIGAEYKGRRAGSMGRYGCFSFFPSKNLGAAGDGGMVTDQRRRRGRKAPRPARSRLEAEVLPRDDRRQLPLRRAPGGHRHASSCGISTSGRPAGRRTPPAIAACSRRPGSDREGAGRLVQLPYEVPGNRHIYNQFVIRVPRRDELQAYLKEQKIGNEVYYPVPLHLQNALPIWATARAISPRAKRRPRRRSPCRSIPSCPTSRPNTWWPALRSF